MGLFIQALNKGKYIYVGVSNAGYFKEIYKDEDKIVCAEYASNYGYPVYLRQKELFTEFDIVSEISDNYWNLSGEDYI